MIRVCNISDIKENSLNKFTIENKEVLVGNKNGKLFACDNSCPHKGASMHKGIYKNNNIVCYMHDYEFDIDSGKLTNMKSWKKSETWVEQNPAWRASGDLIMYDVEIKGNEVCIKVRPNQ